MAKPVLTLAAALALLAMTPVAGAQHNHAGHAGQNAVQTNPVDGAMGAAPETFSLTFEHPMRLTSLIITPRGGDPIAVGALAAEPAMAASVALPNLPPGNYTFAWTASGADNHTMTGRVRYMVH